MKRKYVIFIALALLFVFFNVLNRFYLDLLWFQSLDYGSVFTTILFSQIGISVLYFLGIFGVLFLNLMLARNAVLNPSNLMLRHKLFKSQIGNLLVPKTYTLLALGASGLVALLFSAASGEQWMTVLQYVNRTSFDITEPILNRDVGFYMFELPFFLLVKDYLTSLLVLSIITIGGLYLTISMSPEASPTGWWNQLEGKKHLSLLVSFFFLLKAYDYHLKIYEMLFSPRGAAFGAGYTDVTVQIPMLRVLMFISLGLALFLIFKSFKPSTRSLPMAAGALIIASLLLGSIYPAAIQNFRVEPNELTMEMPYLEHNIEFTRKAFALDDVRTETYSISTQLDPEILDQNQGTIQNIRLWDYRPIKTTYNQLQGIRPYYKFHDIDIDRYILDGTYRQVMLSARELDQNELSETAKTWVNLRLKYTHGYGFAMSPVNEATSEGLPQFMVRNIPPTTQTDLAIDRPEIYYGEKTDPYVIVNTLTEEFDYPLGTTNAYSMYEEESGVTINSFFRKVLFSLRFNDYRLLLSNDVINDSQVLFDRNINTRVRKIAPFLQYDQDPYLVVSEGRLFWMLDAYTTSSNYPYSEPFGGVNYIRNSVKIVIDAYNGEVDYYIVDDSDPLIQVYKGIFPDLFKPVADMPTGLKNHFRYPEDLFNLQSQVYAQYHMEDVRVFYNKEDEWTIPLENYDGQQIQVEPYYTILQLPGEQEPEFVLMLPYNPIRRDNMVAWMAARCDPEHYGERVVYRFPREQTVLGPRQVEGRIDQDTEISSQLTLWDQRGSRVIRGNLLVLPINNSILYVEPVFLQADQGEQPELVRVIVMHEENLVMEETLKKALNRIFGDAPDTTTEEEEAGTVEELIIRANRLITEAKEALGQSDWTGYGRIQEELESTLKSLAEIVDVPMIEEIIEEEELWEEEMLSPEELDPIE
ncbi:UPF0182 family membrane protein [Candidatus Contubernalis alkaliaceticus]|uniref:UPF0182 family membrane protein n=1 Tax=Candidatus Contubernalis alkaliaceticus TaxID=338645 RepID=UPI001F4C375D|nr:UPF0182 family protein [Candidatus Contubernalis alkalaceticus]UNC93404.1 UPF0182 family protein [Candidatus Contubernalis alkalaceticus]